jgi:hypothetical protein
MRPSKEHLITEILSEIERGITYTDCASLFDLNLALPLSTFKIYWREASTRHADHQRATQIEKQALNLDAAKERLKKAILNKDERMELLTKIATGDITMVKEVATRVGIELLNVTPDFAERRAAIAELNKMDGEYAPQRKELTHTTPKNLVIKINRNKDENNNS